MDSFESKVSLLKIEAERLARYLEELPLEAWTKPSACEDWQVQDVVAHLVGVAMFYATTVSRGLQGDSSPPEGRQPAGVMTRAKSATQGIRGQSSVSLRESLGDKLLSEFNDSNEKLNRLLAGLNPEDRSKPCWHPGSIVPAHYFCDSRIKELVVHEWDIRSRLESNAHLWADGLPSIMTLISGSLAAGSVRWGFWPSSTLPKAVRYHLNINGPAPDKTDLVVEEGEVRLEHPGDSAPDVTLHCDSETFILMLYGRLKPEPAMGEGCLVAEGDAELAKQFGELFKGI